MIKLLSSLLSLLDRLWAAWDQSKWQQQGRQQAQKDAADEVQRQLDLAEHAARLDDPDRNERLRSRFDAAASD